MMAGLLVLPILLMLNVQIAGALPKDSLIQQRIEEQFMLSVGIGKMDGPLLLQQKVNGKSAYFLTWVGAKSLGQNKVRVLTRGEFQSLKSEFLKFSNLKKLYYKKGLACSEPVSFQWSISKKSQQNYLCWDQANKREKLALQLSLRKAKKVLYGESALE